MGVGEGVSAPDSSDRLVGGACAAAAIDTATLVLAYTPGPSTTDAPCAAADGSSFNLPSLNVGCCLSTELQSAISGVTKLPALSYTAC